MSSTPRCLCSNKSLGLDKNILDNLTALPVPGGDTSYKWANGDVPLDGVAFSRQD